MDWDEREGKDLHLWWDTKGRRMWVGTGNDGTYFKGRGGETQEGCLIPHMLKIWINTLSLSPTSRMVAEWLRSFHAEPKNRGLILRFPMTRLHHFYFAIQSWAWTVHLFLQCLGQLRLPSFRGRLMRTSFGWEVKAGMAYVWVAGKTVWSKYLVLCQERSERSHYRGDISSILALLYFTTFHYCCTFGPWWLQLQKLCDIADSQH